MEYVYVVEHSWFGDDGEDHAICGIFKKYGSAQKYMLCLLDEMKTSMKANDELNTNEYGYNIVRADEGWDAVGITVNPLMD